MANGDRTTEHKILAMAILLFESNTNTLRAIKPLFGFYFRFYTYFKVTKFLWYINTFTNTKNMVAISTPVVAKSDRLKILAK